MTSQIKIATVIVAYNSDFKKLKLIISKVINHSQIFIADNSDDQKAKILIKDLVHDLKCTYIDMNGNKGIAAAQNSAIQAITSIGNASHVLLLDDDSIPGYLMIQNLISAYRELCSNKIIVLGARTLNSKGEDISNINIKDSKYIESRYMMSSGSFIPIKSFDRVGFFDESLFIDCVDFDWGWRAKKIGIEIFLIKNAVLHHQLGEKKVLGINICSPIRHYYQYRNIIGLASKEQTPVRWKLEQYVKLPLKIFLILFLMDSKKNRLKFAFLGIYHALIKVSGKLPDKYTS